MNLRVAMRVYVIEGRSKTDQGRVGVIGTDVLMTGGRMMMKGRRVRVI